MQQNEYSKLYNNVKSFNLNELNLCYESNNYLPTLGYRINELGLFYNLTKFADVYANIVEAFRSFVANFTKQKKLKTHHYKSCYLALDGIYLTAGNEKLTDSINDLIYDLRKFLISLPTAKMKKIDFCWYVLLRRYISIIDNRFLKDFDYSVLKGFSNIDIAPVFYLKFANIVQDFYTALPTKKKHPFHTLWESIFKSSETLDTELIEFSYLLIRFIDISNNRSFLDDYICCPFAIEHNLIQKLKQLHLPEFYFSLSSHIETEQLNTLYYWIANVLSIPKLLSVKMKGKENEIVLPNIHYSCALLPYASLKIREGLFNNLDIYKYNFS